METKKTNRHAKFYTLLSQMGMNVNERKDFILDYTDGITDSLTVLYEKYPPLYREMISDMEATVKQNMANASQMDKLRKRVIAAIGGYFKKTSQPHDIDYIKNTACRATGYDNFNRIPKERLRNIYNAFTKMQKDFKAVGAINREQLERMTFLN